MDGISSIERTEFVHDEPPESHTLPTSQLKGNGYHHFKAVNIVVYPVVLPDVPFRFAFKQLHVFVNGVYCLADVAAEHIERIAHFLLQSAEHNVPELKTNCEFEHFLTQNKMRIWVIY